MDEDGNEYYLDFVFGVQVESFLKDDNNFTEFNFSLAKGREDGFPYVNEDIENILFRDIELPEMKSSTMSLKRTRSNENLKPFLKSKRLRAISNGALQCAAINQKKQIQCRNAALMEYFGPRPIFCAEHIHLDSISVHQKCTATYSDNEGRNPKHCREIVLKEFEVCHKHFPEKINQLLAIQDYQTIVNYKESIYNIIKQLEIETRIAKTSSAEEYQRKTKILPKFQAMKRVICEALKKM